jgi:hypothetical protein
VKQDNIYVGRITDASSSAFFISIKQKIAEILTFYQKCITALKG